MLVGLVLLAVTAVGGLYVAHGNAPTSLDTLVPGFLRAGHHSLLTDVTSLRYPVVVVAGAVLLALVAAPRDRVRSLVCLIGPPLALVTSELVVKPLVDRTLGSGLSYPSGSTVGAAALGTAAVLAVPGGWRRATIVVASIYGVWMAVAVTSLQSHYPTDALAGLTYGCGVVLVVDWAARCGSDALRRSATAGQASPAGPHPGTEGHDPPLGERYPRTN
jgi:membrane-associated phospholipid phosphatase